ncbi:hypothetical protein ABH933_001262 [Nocardia sp. GP40]
MADTRYFTTARRLWALWLFAVPVILGLAATVGDLPAAPFVARPDLRRAGPIVGRIGELSSVATGSAR